MNLEKSERFQKEYDYFSSKVDKITNPKKRQEYQFLLNALLNEVKSISKKHMDLMSKDTLPDFVNDSRNQISSIRKKLDKMAKEIKD